MPDATAARQPRQVQGVCALFDPLLPRAKAVVEFDHWHRCRESDRDSLDNVPSYFLLPPVIKLGRPRTAMPGQVLHVIERHALGEQIGNPRHPE